MFIIFLSCVLALLCRPIRSEITFDHIKNYQEWLNFSTENRHELPYFIENYYTVHSSNLIDPTAGTIEESYPFTGSTEYFIVPSGISTLTIRAVGASGTKKENWLQEGYGGCITAEFEVSAESKSGALSPGMQLSILVGERGQQYGRRAVGGGGAGASCCNTAGGGGATSVSLDGSLASRIIVAGGGGGGGYRAGQNHAIVRGGDGGGLIGGSTPDGNNFINGAGGSQSSGGDHRGSFGFGGNSDSDDKSDRWWCCTGGAGGGGGYYGGGAGGSSSENGSGGGGSSYASGHITENIQGCNDGNGYLTFMYTIDKPPTFMPTLTPTQKCKLKTAHIFANGCLQTDVAKGLSDQLIEKLTYRLEMTLPEELRLQEAHEGSIKCLEPSSCYPYFIAQAKESLQKVAQAKGEPVPVESAFRTILQQFILWYQIKRGECGLDKSKKVAYPGSSNHNGGAAIDIDGSSYVSWKEEMKNEKWKRLPSKRARKKDPNHFDFNRDDVTVKNASETIKVEMIKAFQELWNENNPKRLLKVDGILGKNTRSKLAVSPCNGW